MVAVDFESLAGIAAVTTLPVGILAGLFLGGDAAAVVFVVGWFLLVPLFGVLSEEEVVRSDAEDETAASSPLDELRERYARGEIDEVEFERRLERLLETEDVELPPEARDRVTPQAESATTVERERER
jgi:uncharacterized membrane protein